MTDDLEPRLTPWEMAQIRAKCLDMAINNRPAWPSETTPQRAEMYYAWIMRKAKEEEAK